MELEYTLESNFPKTKVPALWFNDYVPGQKKLKRSEETSKVDKPEVEEGRPSRRRNPPRRFSFEDNQEFVTVTRNEAPIVNIVENITDFNSEKDAVLINKYDFEKLKKDVMEMRNDISTMRKSEEKILGELVQIRVQLSNIEKTLLTEMPSTNADIVNDDAENEDSFEDKFTFPLSSAEDIEKINKELEKNKDYKKFFLKKFYQIGGTDGFNKGEKVAATLAEVLFSKDVLVNMSWTGISRTTGLKKKIAFQMFSALIGAFYNIVHAADSRWTNNDNTVFFKDKILKHSKQRANAQKMKEEKKRKHVVDSSINAVQEDQAPDIIIKIEEGSF